MKIIKKLKDKLLCPFISALIQFSFLYALFVIIVPSNYQYSHNTKLIRDKIISASKNCGKNNYFSWIILDTKAKGVYVFEDVIGCLDKSCGKSIKNLNQFYNSIHKYDKKSYNYLSKLESGSVIKCNNSDCFLDYPSIKESIEAANHKFSSIAIGITKDNFSNLVYIFTGTQSKENECNIFNKIEEISLFAGDLI